MRGTILALTLALTASAAGAAEIRDCDTWEANARNLWTPVEEGVRSYANGAITLIRLDTEEPACCSSHLMVLHPAGNDEPFRACSLVSFGEGMGYAALWLTEATAGYDPARGLTVEVPGQLWLPEESFQNPVILSLTINQASGELTAETLLGPE